MSNVSFSFRGNNPVREAIHAVFLYHAIRAGLDMAIVNAGMLGVYEEIEPELRLRVEDVSSSTAAPIPPSGSSPWRTNSRRPQAAAATPGAPRSPAKRSDDAWQALPVEQRLSHALVKGIDAFVEADTEEGPPGHGQIIPGRSTSSRAQ